MKQKIKFKIDYEKDVSTFFSFVKDAQYDNGRSLKWAVLDMYPFFKKYKVGKILKISKTEIERFVKDFYQKNYNVMQKNIKIYQINWQKKENKFYSLVDDLFESKYWPKGKYIAYLTIWGLFPRFLKDKTFQLPYKFKNKRYINVIIAHEMLHFVFYEYFLKKYPKYKKDKHDFFVWHISEIFNALIQNSPNWLKVFKIKTMIYPEHKSIIRILAKKYYKKDNWQINELTEDIIKFVDKSKLVKK